MNETDRQIIKKLLDILENLDALYEDEETGRETLMQYHPAFIALDRIVTKPSENK